MNKIHIELKNITKRFGKFAALRDVSLSIPKGSFVTLLGPSGCGKTTLLRILAGFYQQDKGSVFINGKDIGCLPPEKRGTPLVFQDYALFPHMTVNENIGYGLRLQKMNKALIFNEVEHMLELFGLDGMGKRYPRELSGGQQQRVAFARALIMRRDILLLDEPLSNLDAKLRIEVRAQLRNIQRRSGITVIYVTHDQEEALAMSDYIAVMNRGNVQQFAPPCDIYHRPSTCFVADFIGYANLLPVNSHGRNGDVPVSLLGIHTDETGKDHNHDAFAVLRPEHIHVCAPDDGEIDGTVEDSVFQGKTMQYTLRVRDRLLKAEAFDAGSGYSIGQRIGICIDYEKLHVIRKSEAEDGQQIGFEHTPVVDKRRTETFATGIAPNQTVRRGLLRVGIARIGRVYRRKADTRAH
jgi:iron(III) transport system ATP-binding protein/spermidine/putrescine transport system ATP-binding protein